MIPSKYHNQYRKNQISTSGQGYLILMMFEGAIKFTKLALESMVKNKYPTLGEANDIYWTLEDGASGLVLAAETAVGKYPKECVVFLKNMIKTYGKSK